MVVGGRTQLISGRRHGVVIESEVGRPLARMPALTKRRARRTWEWIFWAQEHGAALPNGAAALCRVEGRRVVERQPISQGYGPPPDAEPGAGVREPRRPRPAEGGAEAVTGTADLPQTPP